MIRGLYTAVSGMITQEAKQEVISNNLANVNTVGYKRDDLISKKFEDVFIQNKDKMVLGKNVPNVIGSMCLGSKIDETYVDFQQGVIQSTNKDTDFAIQGRGFFVVSRNNGIQTNNYYTRNGHFHVNNNGFLVNDSGDNVLATNIRTGNVEPINAVKNGKEAKIKCSENGQIALDGVPQYKLYIADFQDYNRDMKKMEDNLYSGQNPVQYNECKIQQSSLEKSNIDVMTEISNMLMTMRSFESNQKIVQSLDETLGKTVNEVGRV